MRRILGLDIGVTSIGWAYVHEPENQAEAYSIQQLGTRIIPLNSDENDEFTKGNAISKNANRRIKRGSRRGNHRYKMRKWKLNKKLEELGMTPSNYYFRLSSIELYGLRVKAINEKISLEELGRIFYHLNQKRGYKSNRKANQEEESGKEVTIESKSEGESAKQSKKSYLELINDRETVLKRDNLTIGQYFYNKLLNEPLFRIKENIFLRKSYEDEFIKIWNKQKEFYPTILTENNFLNLFHEIIYYQRPLKSQKNLISECRFELYYLKNKAGEVVKDENGQIVTKRPKVIPKSSPLFQVAKVWQDVNHIKIRNSIGQEISISLDQKREIFEYLSKNEKISITALKKLLGFTRVDEYCNL